MKELVILSAINELAKALDEEKYQNALTYNHLNSLDERILILRSSLNDLANKNESARSKLTEQISACNNQTICKINNEFQQLLVITDLITKSMQELSDSIRDNNHAIISAIKPCLDEVALVSKKLESVELSILNLDEKIADSFQDLRKMISSSEKEGKRNCAHISSDVNKLSEELYRINDSTKGSINEIKSAIVDMVDKETLEALSKSTADIATKSDASMQQLMSITNKTEALQKGQETLRSTIIENANCTFETIKEIGSNAKKYFDEKDNTELLKTIVDTSNEIIWAEIYNNSTVDCCWARSTSLSAGRAAAGYPFLYIIFRVLSLIKPQSILELGLGETTKLCANYSRNFPNVQHTIIEHDEDWKAFFQNNYELPPNSKILVLPMVRKRYKSDNSVKCYSDFEKKLGNVDFDFIIIDGPHGFGVKEYPRIDVLGIMPRCLRNSFAILLDDCNRTGEQNTLNEMLEVLAKNQIEYCTALYSGKKSTAIITSKNLKFLCSL